MNFNLKVPKKSHGHSIPDELRRTAAQNVPMASVSRNFTRLAVSFARQTSTRPSPRPCPSRSQSKSTTPQSQWNSTRHFSATPFRASEQPPSDEQQDGAASVEDEEPAALEEEESLDQSMLRDIDSDVSVMERQIPIRFTEAIRARKGFWAKAEDDDHAQVPDEKYEDDAITSMAHAELEEHRELREYARIVAWDMPSLASTKHSLLRCVSVC